MNTPSLEEVNTSETGDKTHSLGSHELQDVGNAASSSTTPITSEEVAGQIKAATDPLTKQLEKLCDLMKELRRDSLRLFKEMSFMTQGPSRALGNKFDTGTLFCLKSLI